MKTNVIAGLLFIALFVIFSTLAAHEGEDSAVQKDTFVVAGGDTTLISADNSAVSSSANSEETDDPSGSYDPTWSEIFTEHIHNKIIHFPIGFAIAAFILTLVGFRENKYQTGIFWLVILAGLAAIIAYFSGTAQEEAFEGTSKEWIIEVHETFGLVSLLLILTWAVFLYVKSLKRYAWIVGLILTIIILITATYGGMLAHG